MLRAPGAVHPNLLPVADSGTRGPTCHSPERGKDHRRRELAVGEVSGLGVSTTVRPTARRGRCTRRVSRRSTGTGSLAMMAERRRCSSATRGYRPRQGAQVRARAPWYEDDNSAQDRRERERAEGALATCCHERRPWCRGGGEAQMGLTPGENGGEGGR
jgi:hypothetical protein